MPTADLIKRARTDLGAYHLCTNPEFRWVRFQQVCLVPALHAAAEHKIHALMILMCFRHGKTELGTLSFQAWLTGRWPKRKNMVLSYSDKFAKRFGRKILEKVRSETHQLIFPECEISPTARSGSYFVTTQGGEFFTSGFSGTITGQGVTGCISGEAEIATEVGPMRLDYLVQLVDRPHVLSYNAELGVLEYKTILSAQKTRDADERIVFILSNGQYLQTTPDHLIYDGNCYKPAEAFSTSDRVYTFPAESAMPKMWREQGSPAEGQQNPANLMLVMWGSLYAAQHSDPVLFSEVCEPAPFSSNDRSGELEISPRKELRQAVRRYEAVDSGAGQLSVCDLSCSTDFLHGQMEGADARATELDNSSYQRGRDTESTGEFGDPVRNLPRGTPQIETLSIFAITRLRAPSIPVYDLTVEGNHNFFANGVLVHNCLSIDDPLKGMEEATSKPMLDDRMEDYRSAAGTRLEGGSKVLICNRWCRGDFVDRVLDEEGEVHDGGQWTVIRIPAQAEEGDPLGRRVGDYLWPERLGDEWYERHKAKPRLWNAMCQQNPSKNYGKFFKKEWVMFYPKLVRPGRFPAYMLTDPAKSKGKQNVRTCIIVFVATPEKRILITDASIGRYDPGQRGAECIRLLRKWRPKRWLYEEYGMVSDTWYLEQEAKKAGIHTKPIGVGLRGPRHSLSKETRIEGLIPDFREGRIWLPDIWGDVTEGRPAVPFPTMTIEGVGDYGEKREINCVEYMLEEILNYSGEDSTEHDDFLDCLERIHEEECGIIFPASSIVEQGRSMEYRQNRRQSWESLL